ncbi:MAG: MBL fold metallo-hydrolase [Opitutales bacterium]|nr:MBL fold metallo-hydrolase [Opitutales bacterium]
MPEKAFSLHYKQGLFLPELNLWLDPSKRVRQAFVSHAHADHARAHQHVIATPQTLALMKARNMSAGETQALPFDRSLDLKGGRIELFPAGHVLGSAQIRVETASGSLIYTGDFKTRKGLSCEAAGSRTADVLVMETTFGLPRYRFPSAESVHAELIAFCRQALADGCVPVVMGYSLGKAQEILAILRGQAFDIAVHESIARICDVYRFYGVEFPPYGRLRDQDLDGCVVVIPPNADRKRLLSRAPKTRTAVVTGWGLDPSARFRYGCDAVFPLSDHADYDELLAFVQSVNPKLVYTLHGSAESFAQDLRARGIEARSLISNNQLELEFG